MLNAAEGRRRLRLARSVGGIREIRLTMDPEKTFYG